MLRALLNLKRWGLKKNSPYLEIKTLADYSRDLFVAVVSSHPITAGQKGTIHLVAVSSLPQAAESCTRVALQSYTDRY